MAKQKPERRNPREDRTRLVGLHFRKDNPEAGADVVLGSLLEVVRSGSAAHHDRVAAEAAGLSRGS